MTPDPNLLEQIPTPVIASARLVCEWFDANTEGNWALGGLCSRSMFEKAERQRDALAEALLDCDKAFACWQVGQIPGRPEDILALIRKARTALAALDK